MKRCFLVAAMAAATVLAAPVPAGAAGPSEPFAFHGYSADAVFNSWPGGIQTDADVVLTVGRLTTTDGVAVPVAAVSVEINVGDTLHAFGVAALEPGEFTLDTVHLAFASVQATVLLRKDDGTSMTVDVDVHWTAWGRYDSGKNGGFVVPGDYVLNVTTKNREFMSADGSVVCGATNYTPEETNGGYIQQVNYLSRAFDR